MSRTFLLVVLSVWSISLFSQCDAPTLPKEVNFESKADYRSKDAAVRNCLEWLVSTSLDLCTEERDQLNAYVLVWLSGHPDITVDVNSDAMPFFRSNPELLYPMLHGMTIYQMETPKEELNSIDAHVAGIEAVLDVISDKTLLRTDQFKKLKKLRRKGKLSEFVASEI